MVQVQRAVSFSIDDILSADFDKCKRISSVDWRRNEDPTNSNLSTSLASNNQPKPKARKGSSRKPRITFTVEQLTQLEASFAKENYLTLKEITNLSNKLGLEEQCIRTWFQNRRTKLKKGIAEQQQQQQMPCTLYPCSTCFGLPEQFTCFTGAFCTYRPQPYGYPLYHTQTYDGVDLQRSVPTPKVAERDSTDQFSGITPSSFEVAAPVRSVRLSHFPMKRKAASPQGGCEKKLRHSEKSVTGAGNHVFYGHPESTREIAGKGTCKLNPIVI